MFISYKSLLKHMLIPRNIYTYIQWLNCYAMFVCFLLEKTDKIWKMTEISDILLKVALV